MDRLTSVDASFLSNETASSHMHIGAVLIFEGAPPSYEELTAHIESRLHLVPRYRQKLATPPAETGRPFWVDDPHFNIAYHVRHAAMPAPGDEEQLRRRVARVFSQRLDRSKPLWELWLIQGLEAQALCADLEDPPRRRRRRLRRRHRDGAVRLQGDDGAAHLRARVAPAGRAVGPRARRPRGRGAGEDAVAARPAARGGRSGLRRDTLNEARERGRGSRRRRLRAGQPGARGAAQHADRPLQAIRLDAGPPRRPEGDQAAARWHGQRRRARRRCRRAARTG